MKYLKLLLMLGLLSYQLKAQLVDMTVFEGMKPRSVGPAGMSGRVTAIDAVLSDPDIIYIGTASGGIWKSKSGGIYWEPVFDENPILSIGAIAVNQRNPDVIWAGTGEGNPRNSQSSGIGLFKSINGGKTWMNMGLKNSRNIHRIIIHRDNPDIVLVGVQGTAWGESPDRGVFKTTDGGKTWKKVLYVDGTTGIADLVADPSNPDKLIAAMWQFRRYPWFFNSGGPGSGLYISYDAGETWVKRTDQDGLPEGELGRIGIAIAPSNKDIVYALIESKKNALYRSGDGGFKWEKVSDKNIGDRPFYYAEIYVDPKNENRLYNLHSTVTLSEDGGRTFQELLDWTGKSTDIHPDHHAWYVHPENPDFLINGNDGGLAISRDRGKTWQFVENLPLGQYYHISVDMDQPYHIYGGMQDNGSWRGPAYVWRTGGIRNNYWQELFFGDGFDVSSDPENSRYGYAMSQGGYLARIDIETGNNQLIKPVHPEGTFLRFNWNAGFAQDPFDPNTIYYGSQFLHKSSDKGLTWEIISPDLTTNDPEKQKQLQSGGLTFDVTNAENFTTIISIAPSPVEKGLIWVGTDDGHLQVTRDGGKTWTLLTDRIKTFPRGAWIPQIHPSSKNAAEVFVVVNNYRLNDWTPYLYYSMDYGKTWQNLVNVTQVDSYLLSVVQDPDVPELIFLGAETGLYISFDKGKSWNKWTKGYPSVSTMDLVIHPREKDLVIGTFGRAAWVIDDIRPLREIASSHLEILEKPLHVFQPPDAYLVSIQQAEGPRFAGFGIFSGDNRPFGGMISVYLKDLKALNQESGKAEKKPETDTLKVEVYDQQSNLIRTFRSGVKKGMNRITWDLRAKAPRNPSATTPTEEKEDRPGFRVLPGTYKLKIGYYEQSDSCLVQVRPDPRLEFNLQAALNKKDMYEKYYRLITASTQTVDRLNAMKNKLEIIGKQLKPGEPYDSLRKEIDKVRDTVQYHLYLFLPNRDIQGIASNPQLINYKLNLLGGYLNSLEGEPTASHHLLYEQTREAVRSVIGKVNDWTDTGWKSFEEWVKNTRLELFEDYEPIKIE